MMAILQSVLKRDAAVLNERTYPYFAIKLVAMATSLEKSIKEVRNDLMHANTI